MLKSYLIIALRSLLTQRLYSAINVFGVAIGLASCILMSLFVFSEMGFDTYHTKADNIVRVVTDLHPPGSTELRFSTSQYKIGEAFVQEFSELTGYTRFRNVSTSLGTQGRMFNEALAYVTDANVFDFFGFEVVNGELKTALTRPNTVVLTESSAVRFLGSTDVVGQTLRAGNNIALEVTAVIKDLPDKTHLAINSMISWGTMGQMLDQEGWEENPSFNYYTYFETTNGTDVEALEAKIPAYMEEKVREGIAEVITLKLQRLKDIYLTSKQAFEMKSNGDINTVYAFSTIAILILLIACINFMNLSTARATKRAKEVGVRKVMGAYKSHLVMQFLGEALLTCFLSMIIACGVVEAILPIFSQFVGKELTFSYLTDSYEVLHPQTQDTMQMPILVVSHDYYPERFANMSIKFEGDVTAVSQHINDVWQQVMPNQPIVMDYMDDEFNAMYTEEDRQMTIFNLFSALAIFIACLGLFGLASFTTERRTKEIGIRKVIGASVTDIVVLLSMEFSKLVLLANFIAWPIAWYVMSNWLTNFVYRIDMNPMIFVTSALVAFVIAW